MFRICDQFVSLRAKACVRYVTEDSGSWDTSAIEETEGIIIQTKKCKEISGEKKINVLVGNSTG